MTFGALHNEIVGSHSEREWNELVIAWGWRCFYCGRPVQEKAEILWDWLTKDHLTPLSRGGSDDIGNLVPACFSCNRLKGTMTIDEFRSVRPALFTAEQNARRKSYEEDALGVKRNPALVQAVTYLAPRVAMNPADDPAFWLRRRETLRQQTLSIARMRLESAGQLNLPIFGDGSAKKLAESETATLPFKGMAVTK
jgi:hypothetical protein